MSKKEWFKEWFNTPYYHILYKNRDFKEAELFINNLVKHLKILPESKILDLACGKGRHAYFLAKKGFNVTGLDLSEQSIAWAKKEYNLPNLKFDVHDMRDIYNENSFDFLLNMFTSFGYFNSHTENQKVVNSMYAQINDSGTIVIDFLNIEKALKKMVPTEKKEIEGITFNISKNIENNNIIKKIEFCHNNIDYSFTERVEMLTLIDFKKYFTTAGLELKEIFGSYNLDPFDEKESDRLIMIVKK